MNWLKTELQNWLEIKVQHQCQHHWSVLEKQEIEELYQLPAHQIGHFEIPNSDKNTYKMKKTRYIMQCFDCGELTSRIF